MNYFVSIIIPVYNIEKYIEECVNSVLVQSYKNFEVILVDDGSKDRSSIICDDLANLDNRIKVIHKKNGGLSSARNAGIKASKGDYIAFIDGDDYWDDRDFLKDVVKCLDESKADFISFGLKKYYENEDFIQDTKYIFDRNLVDINNKKKTLDYLISNNLYISSAWSKIVKRDIIMSNNLFFKEGILSEDIDWSARLLIYADKIDVIEFLIFIVGSLNDQFVGAGVLGISRTILLGENGAEVNAVLIEITVDGTDEKAVCGGIMSRMIEQIIVKCDNDQRNVAFK